jgi:4-amino-4-deoxy-L-arabinose transferase-like glycosyltransferase
VLTQEQVRNKLRTWLAGPPGSGPVEQLAMTALVASGLFFRARGVLFGERIEMWIDEAAWAMRMFERPLSEHMIRPPGFVIFSRLSARLLGGSEFAYRLLPWLAGMAAPIVAVLLARRFLKNPAARIVFVAVISLSLPAIDFSKEFKQYAIGILIQLLLPLLALRWVATKRRRDLIIVCAVAPLALMFSQDVMFLYPGLFLTLAIEAWRNKDFKQLGVAVGGGAAAAALVVGMYLLVWSRIPKGKAEEHWGRRYDVFYLEPGRVNATKKGHAAWLLSKYEGMAALPGSRRSYWREGVLSEAQVSDLSDVDYGLWLVLHAAGLATLFGKRRWRECLLFWSPVLVLSALNFAGRWPIGAFRTNMFLIPGMTAIMCTAVEWFRPSEAKLRSLVPALVIVVAPFVLFERHWHTRKQGEDASGVFAMLQVLEAKRGAVGEGRERLYMDQHACDPFKYYTRYHPEGIALWSRLEPKITPVCGNLRPTLAKMAARRPSHERVWLLFSKPQKLPSSLKVASRSSKLVHTLTEARVR